MLSAADEKGHYALHESAAAAAHGGASA